MDDGAAKAIVGIAVAVISLATVSVILSSQAQTAGVINAGSSGLASIITAAVAPVTGGSSNPLSLASGLAGGDGGALLPGLL